MDQANNFIISKEAKEFYHDKTYWFKYTEDQTSSLQETEQKKFSSLISNEEEIVI